MSQKKTVKQLIGETKRERGAINEKKVRAAFIQTPENKFTCSWLKKIEFADKKQDAKGIDIIVHTHDVGKIHLQIKSSAWGAKKHKKKYRNKIPVAIIKVGDTSKEIREKVLAVIKPIRDKYLEIRGVSSKESIAAVHKKNSDKSAVKKLKGLLDRIICDPRWRSFPPNLKEVNRLLGELAKHGVYINPD